MKSATTPNTPALTADADRGEVLLTIAGRPRLIRFNVRFLKALTDQKGGSGPADALKMLETSPLAGLVELAAVGIRLSIPSAELPADFDAEVAIDEMSREELKNLFSVLMDSITANPLLAVLNQTKAA